jgi:hypothetical protein
MKECYHRYLQREQAIRRSKACEIPAPLTQNEDEAKLSNAELYLNALVAPKTETKFEQYLQQDRSLRETDIYAFWKAKQYNYPIVARIAKDYLSILATSAPSECVFSQGGDIVTKKRNKLTSDSIRMIVCLKA